VKRGHNVTQTNTHERSTTFHTITNLNVLSSACCKSLEFRDNGIKDIFHTITKLIVLPYFLNSTRSKRQKQKILLERPEGEGVSHQILHTLMSDFYTRGIRVISDIQFKKREKWMQLLSILIQPFPQTKVTNSITRNNF
jgi:hypothetical protein